MNSTTNQGGGKAINEYRPAKVPKVRMGAADVLGVVHDKVNDAAVRAEKAAERNEAAAKRAEDAVAKMDAAIQAMQTTFKTHSAQLKGTISKDNEEAKAELVKQCDGVLTSSQVLIWDFKEWVKRWGIGITLFLVVIVISGIVWWGGKRYNKGHAAALEAVQHELDSLRHDNRILWQFAEDNPRTWDAWIEKQRKGK